MFQDVKPEPDSIGEVYEIFETMMKSLIVEQPSDPIKFLLDRLEKPQPKRILIMGPPGSKRKEHILTLEEIFEEYKYETISVGDLLKKEVAKKSELGKLIHDSMVKDGKGANSYVKDEVVVELITKQIKQLPKENDWIIEGFPRTRGQALALARMDFIPDKIILLDVDDELTKERIRENLLNAEEVKDDIDGRFLAENSV